MKIIIENINLPSENKRLAKSRNGRFFRTAEYTQKMEFLQWQLLKHKTDKKIEMFEGKIGVRIKVKTYLDIDNFLKGIFDSLESVGIIKNDRNILKLDIVKYPCKRGELDDLELEIYAIRNNA